MDKKCRICDEPNENDSLSPDGLCFVCEVESDTAQMPPDLIMAYLDALSKVTGKKAQGEVLYSGSRC